MVMKSLYFMIAFSVSVICVAEEKGKEIKLPRLQRIHRKGRHQPRVLSAVST